MDDFDSTRYDEDFASEAVGDEVLVVSSGWSLSLMVSVTSASWGEFPSASDWDASSTVRLFCLFGSRSVGVGAAGAIVGVILDGLFVFFLVEHSFYLWSFFFGIKPPSCMSTCRRQSRHDFLNGSILNSQWGIQKISFFCSGPHSACSGLFEISNKHCSSFVKPLGEYNRFLQSIF